MTLLPFEVSDHLTPRLLNQAILQQAKDQRTYVVTAAESSTEIRPQKHPGSHRQERFCGFAPAPTTVEFRQVHQAKPARIARRAQSLRKIRYPTASEDLDNHPPAELKCSFRPYTP